MCLSVCHFVLVFFSPFSIAITSLGEERANLSAFRTFVQFVLIWICRFPLPFGGWEGLRFVIVALTPWTFLLSFFCLQKAPVEPLHKASKLHVTIKTAILFAKRCTEIHALPVGANHLRFNQSDGSVSLIVQTGLTNLMDQFH